MQHLGRKYHDTPRGLEDICEAFSFHVDAIIVYVTMPDLAISLAPPQPTASQAMWKPSSLAPSLDTSTLSLTNGLLTRPLAKKSQTSPKAKWIKSGRYLWYSANACYALSSI